MSPEPIQAAAGPSEPVPYLVAPQPSAPNPVPAAASAPTQAKTQADNSASTPAPPVDTAAGSKAAVSPVQPAAPTTQAAAHEQLLPANCYLRRGLGQARDADVKRTTERRRVDRRQQWVEKRRYQQRQDQELRAVEERVREETEPRREFAVEPVRIETPRISCSVRNESPGFNPKRGRPIEIAASDGPIHGFARLSPAQRGEKRPAA